MRGGGPDDRQARDAGLISVLAVARDATGPSVALSARHRGPLPASDVPADLRARPPGLRQLTVMVLFTLPPSGLVTVST